MLSALYDFRLLGFQTCGFKYPLGYLFSLGFSVILKVGVLIFPLLCVFRPVETTEARLDVGIY
ncbi:hypothetical protein SUGI_0478040, partial [Cryptomeria japonica]